jgi:hypothetical protein
MRRRVLLVALFALDCAAILHAAPDAPATPQAVPMSLEKTLPAAAVSREKSVPKHQDKIWSGLVLATNAPDPKDPPAELREFAGRLKRVFGYNQFQLAGSAANVIDDDGENWLVPSKNFSLSVKARPATSKEARGGYLLNLQLFQDQRPLVDTEAKLAPGSPLFIRGPACGKGHLIIVLQVQR